MPGKKSINFNKFGNVLINTDGRGEGSVITYMLKNNRGDSIIVSEYTIKEDYDAIKETYSRLGSILCDSLSVPSLPYAVADYYVARKPVTGKFPILLEEWRDLSTQIDACLQVCKAFKELDSKSFFIKDFDRSNIGINPQSGKVNIGIFGCIERLDKFKLEQIIPGRYVLPLDEMQNMMEEPKKCIGYTLAVLLFEILLGCHPYEGRKLATMAFIKEEDIIANYGEKRVFIFDPQNDGNAPVPGEQTKVTTRWSSLPDEIQNAFIKVFVEKQYFLPQEWSGLIEGMKKDIYTCPYCKKQTFIKIHESRPCIWCGNSIDATFVLKNQFNEKIIPLVEGSDIKDDWGREVLGKVLRANDRLIIKNVSRQTWDAFTPSGIQKQLPINGTMPVNVGIKVKIGGYTYIIEQ